MIEKNVPFTYDTSCNGALNPATRQALTNFNVTRGLRDIIDGSSNTDINGSMGSIFSIRKRAPRHTDDVRDLLGPGSQQVGAGYVLYGPATQLVYTSGAGVDMFTFDAQMAEFVLWKENLKMPERGPYYSCNQGNITKWAPGAQTLVRHLTSRKDKSTSYSLRYCGAFVADFGIGETANFPATFDWVLSLIAATGYGQLRMNAAFPFWKAKRASSSCQVSTSSGATREPYSSSRMNSSARTASGLLTTTSPFSSMIRPPNAPRYSTKPVIRPS